MALVARHRATERGEAPALRDRPPSPPPRDLHRQPDGRLHAARARLSFAREVVGDAVVGARPDDGAADRTFNLQFKVRQNTLRQLNQ